MKPIASFPVTTRQSKHYFKVKIFNTKEDMYQYYMSYVAMREESKKKYGSRDFKGFRGFRKKLNFEAIVMPYENLVFKKGKKPKRSLHIGEVLIHKNRMGSGLVSHEMLHCAMWHERLIKGNTNAEFGHACGEREERLAYALYDFMRTFTMKCYKLKLY